MPGEVDDRVNGLLVEDRQDRVGVSTVGHVPGEDPALGLRHPIEPDHVVAAVDEADGEDLPDRPGRAGDQDPHGRDGRDGRDGRATAVCIEVAS
ncbi:hypothetical protein NPS01_34100 [Nocardioides psychrotolerans]|nr:hypothetical protein NPS01_34100 [Nocardioides psychrotolerans]